MEHRFSGKNSRLFYVIISFLIIIIVASVLVGLNSIGEGMMKADYERAVKLYESGDPKSVKEAEEVFKNLGTYGNSKYYDRARFRVEINNLKSEYELLKSSDNISIELLQGFLTRINELIEMGTSETEIVEEAYLLKKRITYDTAIALYNNGQYDKAMKLFQDIIGFEDSEFYIAQITLISYPNAQKALYIQAEKLFEEGNYRAALKIFEELGDYEKSEDEAVKCRRFILASSVSAGIKATFYIDNQRTIKHTRDVSQTLSSITYYGKPISISALGEIAMVLDENDRAHVYGISDQKKNYLESIPGIVQVATGEQYAVELDEHGRVYAAGHNGDGQCNVEEEWKNFQIKEIDCGWRTTVGLDMEGNVLIEGYGKDKYLSMIKTSDKWKNLIHISTGGGGNVDGGKGHIVGLREDNTVVAVGDNTNGQCDTDDWKDVIKISAGDYHTVGLRGDGRVYTTIKNEPKIKDFPEKIVDISAGLGYTVYVGESGKAYTDDNPYKKQGQVDDISNWQIYVK